MTDNILLEDGETPEETIKRLHAENRALQKELHELQQFLHALQAIGEAAKEDISQSGTPEEDHHHHLKWWLNNILQKTLDLLSAPDGSVLWLDPETNELEFVVVQGISKDLEGKRLHVGEGVAGWVAEHNEACIIENVQEDDRFSSRIDGDIGFETRSLVAAPLTGHGAVLGVVEVLNQSGQRPFGELERAMLDVFCNFAGEALANIKPAKSSSTSQ